MERDLEEKWHTKFVGIHPLSAQIFLFWSMIAMFVINGMSGAGIGPFQGRNNGVISNKYPTLFTPDGWAFSIWGLIFVALAILGVYLCQPRMRTSQALKRLCLPLSINFLSNAVWGVAFSFEAFWLTILIMLSILFTLLWSYKIIQDLKCTELASLHPFTRFVVFQFTVSLYLGWIAVATIANFSIFFSAAPIYWVEGQAGWSAALMLVAAALSVFMLYSHSDVVYASVCVWALCAISTKQTDSLVHVTSQVLAGAVGMLVLVRLALSLWKAKDSKAAFT